MTSIAAGIAALLLFLLVYCSAVAGIGWLTATVSNDLFHTDFSWLDMAGAYLVLSLVLGLFRGK